jgi:probable F420-dependent oxidoreductase
MRFGVFVNTQAVAGGPAMPEIYDQILETVEVAEEAGFDLCFLPEHHQQSDGYLPSPFVMAGAVAAHTSRIGIATGIHLLPLWDPMRVAEDVAVVDNLSKGRFTLGVGLGLVQREFDQFHIDMSTAPSRLEEQVAVLRQAWSDGPVTFAGEHFRYEDVDVTPKPVQRPGPRILFGGMSAPAVRRAGRLGDGWLTDPLHSAAALSDWATLYRRTADEAGRTSSIWLQRDCWVAERPVEVEELWAPWLVEDWRFYFRLGLFQSGRFNPAAEPWVGRIQDPSDITFSDLHEDRVVVGTPPDVLSTLQSMQQRLRPDTVCFRFRFPGGPGHEATLGAIRLFGREVIPRMRAAALSRPTVPQP